MCNCAWYKKLIKENCVTKNDFSYEKNVSGTRYRYVRLPAYKKTISKNTRDKNSKICRQLSGIKLGTNSDINIIVVCLSSKIT